MQCISCFHGLLGRFRDQAALETQTIGPSSRKSFLEKAVAAEWERVLGLPEGTVGTEDGFMELGGESLLALRACAAAQFLLSDAPLPKDDEPQFGMLSGPYAVQALLDAPSLAAYCDHLRRHGCRLQERALADAQKQAAGQSIKDPVWMSTSTGASWPEVRAAARRMDDSAAARLETLLKDACSDWALHWCGAAPRAAAAAPRFNALHAAAQAGATECVQLLIQRRARVTSTESGASMTPAHYAAMNSANCLQLLLDAKAPLTIRDARGQSLLHAAARAGNVASLRLVLAKVQDSSGTARAFRSGEGSKGFMAWTDRWARTAVHWAALNGHGEVLALLLQHGASPEPPLISEHQMGKRTHMTQETPSAIALRVHGPQSSVAKILADAMAHADNAAGIQSRREQTQAESPPETSAPSKYVVTIAEPKLERLAMWELKERLNADVQKSQCRILFTSSAAPVCFLGLKAAEKICAVALNATKEQLGSFADATVSGSDSPEQSAAQWILESSTWCEVLSVWRRFHGVEDGDTDVLTFKVTCRRKGSRFAKIPSQGLAVALASALTKKYGWRAQVRQPDLEIRVLINDSDMLVDLPLLFQPSVRIGGGELVEAGLSAHVAWALARTAELAQGDNVLDPMCGKAVILAEAALSWPHCQYLGLELDCEQLRGAARNVAMITESTGVDLLQGDARRLPIPNESVDALICDIPFGKQYSTIEECRDGLYDEILAEFNRVVCRHTGRMVLLSSLEQEPWVLRAAGFDCPADNPAAADISTGVSAAARAAEPPWVCIGRRRTPLGFLEAVILAFRRPQSASPELHQGVRLPELSDRLWWETSGGRSDWASLKVAQRPPMQLARGREI